MNKNCKNFVEEIGNNNELLKSLIEEETAYWSPDEIPITTLFSMIGHWLFTEFSTTSSDENERRFNIIESAMNSGDEQLMTAVATGLIEILIIKSSEDKVLWPQVMGSLGFESKSYVEAWIAS